VAEPPPDVPPDAADEAMVRRARERFRSGRARRVSLRRLRRAELPNLILIGGLKCGTTSLHHYLNLHPEIHMSRPKELNFFVAELNWPLGDEWYAAHFPAAAPVRGESSPHYTNLPRFRGVADRMRSVVPGARLVYMVREPIDRMLSHYLHNVAGGYERRPIAEALAQPDSAYVHRSMYAMQLEPYVERFGSERIEVVSREELKAGRDETMRRVFRFVGVDESFTSPQFDREWETGGGKVSGRFRLMDRAVRAPGLRAIDRGFDRLPESLRWLVERVIHDPRGGGAERPELPVPLRERLAERFRPDVERLEAMAGRRFGWSG
jgi:Sulfotransferase domain